MKRWAAERSLPVHRVAGEQGRRGLPVYAFVRELDAWRRTGTLETANADDEADDRNVQADPPDADGESDLGLTDRGAPTPASSPPKRARLLVAGVAAALALVIVAAGAWWMTSTGPAPTPATVQTAYIPEEARELYLRGTYLWNRRTPEGIAGAIEAFDKALAIEPDYAEAHAGLAMTYNLARQYSGMSGFEAYPKAEMHARRAVELDPTLAFAQSVLAFVEFHWLWDVEAGLARFEEAMRLDPDSSNTLMWYASSLIHADKADEALPLINKAQAADPDSTAILNMKALALFHSGQPDAATDLLREIMERDPSFAWAYPTMYYIQLRQQDYAGYLRNYARLGELIGVPRYGEAAAAGTKALAEGGVEAMAAAMIAVETEYYERGEALAWDIARHHAMMGDANQALHWLRIGLERREERLIGILVDTSFDPLRGDAGFERLVAEIGLPAQS